MSPLTRTGQPQPRTADLDGAALRTTERRKAATYPELRSEGPQRFVVPGSEVGGRFNGDAHGLLRDLVRVRACRAPPALRAAATSGWTRRWWSILSVAVQQAVTSTALGRPWPLPPHAARATGPPLDRLLDLAEAEGPSCLPGRRSRRCARPSFRRKGSRSRWSSVVSQCSRYWRGKRCVKKKRSMHAASGTRAAPRGAHARAAASRRVPEGLRALPVRPQHQGRRGSPVVRAIRVSTESDPRTTVLSVDGGRLRPHFSTEHAVSLGGPTSHDVQQGEGGEQGDPLMPSLFALSQHQALLQSRTRRHPSNTFYAFLDDIYVTGPPEHTVGQFGHRARGPRATCQHPGAPR